jgi:phosphoglycerate dehydrogenase-like enzyme
MDRDERPQVALLLPRHVHDMMFRAEELARLATVARLVGPYEPPPDEARLRGLIHQSTAVITGWGSRISVAMLEAASRLKFVAHSAGTIRNVLPADVFERGLRVSTAAGANAVPVAQYTVAGMVMLLKQTPWLTAAMAAGDTAETRRRAALCRELEDIRIGLIGASRVGREVIKLLRCYSGLEILVADPFLSDSQANALGVRCATLEEVCSCDVVSIHAPALPETRHLLNARTLALLPDHAVLINTARGALVDEAALLAEVRRRPLYCLLDVTDPEPPALDAPIRREKHILITPHIAGAMSQARKRMGAAAIDEVIRFLTNKPLQHEVHPDALAIQA